MMENPLNTVGRPTAPFGVLVASLLLVVVAMSAWGQQAADADAVQALLKRIEALEQSRPAPTSPASVDTNLVGRLLKRIEELEGKVRALETGRVMPAITLAPEDGPTLEELDQKIRVLDRKRELADEVASARSTNAPQITVGAEGFSIASADRDYLIRLRGLIQGDTRTFFDDHPLAEGNDGFFLRRARPILEGTLFGDLDFRFQPEFSTSSTTIYDAYLDYEWRPQLAVRVGRFKGPVGYENLLPDSAGLFNERSFVSGLVPIRSQGLQLGGEFAKGLLSYSAGVFNAVGDGRVASNEGFGDNLEFAARLLVEPFKHGSVASLRGLGFGVSGSYSDISSNATLLPTTSGGTRPGYVTSALQPFFAYNPVVGPVVADGRHLRLSPHAYFLKGPFGILGEYAVSQQGVLNATTLREAELAHRAWQVSAQWVLTGEDASFYEIKPRRPFRWSDGGSGAWQLVARFGQFDVDDDAFLGFSDPRTSATSATSWSVGINWWLSRNLRILTSFTHTTFDGGGQVNPLDSSTFGAPATVTHQDEKALLTRVQLAF
jgi:phosphate-selective porin OprO/OprP